MQVRIFRVPFAGLGDLAELEFGEQDYLMVRPLFSLPRAIADTFLTRLRGLREGEQADEEVAAQIVCDVLGACVTEWHLVGSDGEPIGKPTTRAELEALPAALHGMLSTFFFTFRGQPTTHPTIAA